MHTHTGLLVLRPWCWAGTCVLAPGPPPRLRDGSSLLLHILHRPRPPHRSPGSAQQHRQHLRSPHRWACGGSCSLSQLPTASHMQGGGCPWKDVAPRPPPALFWTVAARFSAGLLLQSLTIKHQLSPKPGSEHH